MRAMLLIHAGQPLRLTDLATPTPGVGQVLVKVSACAVCRTDLHVVDGELPNPKLPLVPGHEIVGRVAALGEGVTSFKAGERVGISWLGWTCGECHFCRSQRENLRDAARFTGYTLDGGYAEYTVADVTLKEFTGATFDFVLRGGAAEGNRSGHSQSFAAGSLVDAAVQVGLNRTGVVRPQRCHRSPALP